MCTRTVCALAKVFEEAGIATVVLASMREIAQRMHTPRVLHCEFPLGRPLGKPGDAAFQHDVLARAFELLDASEPTIVDHPEVIVADEAPLACPVPPHYESTDVPAVAEARGLRPAFDRAYARRRATAVGRVVDPDGIPDALGALAAIAASDAPTLDDVPGHNPVALAHDVRAYYEESGAELVAGEPGGSAAAPGARSLESWFFEQTEAGKVLLAARAALRSTDVPFDAWFYMASAQR